MNKLKNILLLILVIAIPMASLQAQKKKKKASTTSQKAKSKASSSKKTSTKKGKASTSSSKGKKATSRKAERTPDNLTTLNATSALVSKNEGNGSDTSINTKEVTITSSFKPSLRNAAKINFTAATPVLDTSKIPLTYNIPSSNLFFTYRPVAIKPVALFIDTSFDWNKDAYVKAGFGNYSSPYLEAAMAFGDGKKSMLSLHGKYTAAKGNLPFQEYSKAGIDLLGSFNLPNNHELTGEIFLDHNSQYQYGYTPSTLVMNKDSLKQSFNTIGFEASLQNKKANQFGITYHPQISVNTFFDSKEASEANFLIKAPITKEFNKILSLSFSAVADITSYKKTQAPSNITVNNNLFYIAPSVKFITPNLKLNLGLQPSWDNSAFAMLPNFTAEAKIENQPFVLLAGWQGYFNKNSYQSLTAVNPYIQQPSTLQNTKNNEIFFGLKGSAGKHFTYQSKLSFVKMNNVALFVNDTATLKTQQMNVLFESQLSALRWHTEISYTEQEKLSLTAAANYTQFTKQINYGKAYGLLPLEITGALRWKLLKDVLVKSDVFFWSGSHYQQKDLSSGTLSPAFDANIGTEFTVMPKLNIWLQFNNVFNNKYQRFNQYEVLGFQVVGGVVYSFR